MTKRYLAQGWAGLLFISASTFAVTANAACVNPAPMSPAQIAEINTTPGTLLTANPDNARLLNAVRNAVVSDVGVLDAVRQVIPNANPDQRAAIGTALAQAAALCVRTESRAAEAVQLFVATNDVGAITTAFRAASGDVRTAATGGAGGGAGGGGGGGGSLGGSGVQNGTDGGAGNSFATLGGNTVAYPNTSGIFGTSTRSATITPSGNNARTFPILGSASP